MRKLAKKFCRRLDRLRGLLLADAKKADGIKFDLAQLLTIRKPQENLVSCGTTGCAMGLAAISGEFNPEGLSYRQPFSVREKGDQLQLTLNGRLTFYNAAAQHLFGIDSLTSLWLFNPQYYPRDRRQGATGERTVARRISYVIRRGRAPDSVYRIHGPRN